MKTECLFKPDHTCGAVKEEGPFLDLAASAPERTSLLVISYPRRLGSQVTGELPTAGRPLR